MSAAIRELEELVIDAWPASETTDLDGWLLRHSGGPSRRGNSVATTAFRGERLLSECIADVEAWYAARGTPPLFQIGPCVRPKELEQVLTQRGYEGQGHAAFAAASAFALSALRVSPHITVRVAAKPEPAWLEVLKRGRFSADAAGLHGFLKRLGTRCRFATALDEEGRAIAAALGIACEERLGVYSMLTLPEARRRGAARALLRGLAESALPDAMRELYLLVERDNAAARSLYASAGFRDIYSYHYMHRSG